MTFKLSYPDGVMDLPLTAATEGPGGASIGALLKDTNTVTLDPGFMNTASCSRQRRDRGGGRRDDHSPGLLRGLAQRSHGGGGSEGSLRDEVNDGRRRGQETWG